jgi:hypothetical protein
MIGGEMINMLSSNENEKNLCPVINKTIKDILFENDSLNLFFEEGIGIRIYDDGQSCCERRYMTTDDDLKYFIGSDLKAVEIGDGPTTKDEDGEHEIQFLKVITSRGVFTIATHNEHNGYYSVFCMKVDRINQN